MRRGVAIAILEDVAVLAVQILYGLSLPRLDDLPGSAPVHTHLPLDFARSATMED